MNWALSRIPFILDYYGATGKLGKTFRPFVESINSSGSKICQSPSLTARPVSWLLKTWQHSQELLKPTLLDRHFISLTWQEQSLLVLCVAPEGCVRSSSLLRLPPTLVCWRSAISSIRALPQERARQCPVPLPVFCPLDNIRRASWRI